MPLFRRGLPKRAVAGAFIGFVFGVLYMPTGGTREFLIGAVWVLFSIALLFGRSFAYYTYVGWALLWMAWRGVAAFQGKVHPVAGIIEVVIPLVSIALLSSSGYVETVRPAEPAP